MLEVFRPDVARGARKEVLLEPDHQTEREIEKKAGAYRVEKQSLCVTLSDTALNGVQMMLPLLAK